MQPCPHRAYILLCWVGGIDNNQVIKGKLTSGGDSAARKNKAGLWRQRDEALEDTVALF